ncbi:DsbC family protein [Acinetobacter sp. MD2]|uniref:DsbC family protein n=1 Tax=Acinetobacter sp. MD2 TaxID=2600066 RepID=UPI002D1EEBD1|nr:DsbC family protein [Acinetobacter sp. MD2]MEB3768340.1 DsbC family protein [Acinetobacter sp. MD2]
MKKLSLLILSSLMTSIVYANTSHLAVQLKQQYPNLNFQNLAPTETSRLYSATLGQRVVYLDEAGQHLFVGQMIRLKDQKDLTQDLINIMPSNRMDWKKLPLNDAIEIVKGNGQQQLAIFEDPNCPYCQKLEPELDKLNNVTIYVFLYPLRPQSVMPSKQVWCSESRAFAWKNLMQMKIQPKATKYCDNPIARNLALGQQLKLVGTPTLIFKDGSFKTGWMSSDEIQQHLAK